MEQTDMSPLFSIRTLQGRHFLSAYHEPYYHILLFKGEGSFEINFVKYRFAENTVLFLAPYQNFRWIKDVDTEIQLLKFHGDFYCIEYHKKEIACNGLLFNNIYQTPHFNLIPQVFDEIKQLMEKMNQESNLYNPFSESILKSYLQLILALCSKEKSILLRSIEASGLPPKEIVDFQELLERHFIEERSASFYAARFALSSSAFGKKIKQQFGKTPTQLIQERVVLEAKKLLHLTHKPIKVIAAELSFDDEFYFSRYFKKKVGLSPAHYREKVGISIAAK